MAPKEKKTRLTRGRREGTPDDVDEALGFDHTTVFLDNTTETIHYTWTAIVNWLHDWMEHNRKYADTDALHRYVYDRTEIEQEFQEVEAKTRYDDAKNADVDAGRRKGTSTATKDAKREWENAKRESKNRKTRFRLLQKEIAFGRVKRTGDHESLAEAQHHLEDFLFYQDTMRRWKRHRTVDQTRVPN